MIIRSLPGIFSVDCYPHRSRRHFSYEGPGKYQVFTRECASGCAYMVCHSRFWVRYMRPKIKKKCGTTQDREIISRPPQPTSPIHGISLLLHPTFTIHGWTLQQNIIIPSTCASDPSSTREGLHNRIYSSRSDVYKQVHPPCFYQKQKRRPRPKQIRP